MSSNINPANIDGTYPIAGQDNDSQGFRDNFTNIKNNFTYAQTEITDLQTKAVLKSALTGTTLNNDFAGSAMSGAQIVDFRETIVAQGNVSGALAINHKAGHYHTMTIANSTTLSFTNFPAAGQLGRVRLDMTVTNTGYTVTLPASVTVGNAYVRNLTNSNVLTFDETGRFVYEISTTDGGTNYIIFDLSRQKPLGATTRTPTSTGQQGDVPGMMAYNPGAGWLYICNGYYDGSTHIWYKASLAAV
jgi:hypothetical protein